MASITHDPNGTRRLQLIDPRCGRRRAIRLGKVTAKQANTIRHRVESIIAAIAAGSPLDADTAAWVGSLPDSTHAKLARAGLCEPRERAEATPETLGAFLDRYFDTLTVKASTRVRYGQGRRLLIEHFGADAALRGITPRQADEYRAALAARYAPAKVSREIRLARMFMRTAKRWGLIDADPFEGVVAGSQHNRDRLAFVKPEDAEKLIDAAPDHDWRAIVALCRFGGLRCPSEVLRVRWADCDWERGRLRVTSPKTEHHAGRGERVIPLFPELRRVLLDAFEDAPEGAERVVERYAIDTPNLGTHFTRLIRRAGLTPWPRSFTALRASRATELWAQYPKATCEAWMGHSAAIASEHYVSVRDEDFDRACAASPKAAQNPAHDGAATPRTPAQADTPEPRSRPSERRCATERKCLPVKGMGTPGLEPGTPAFSMPCSTN